MGTQSAASPASGDSSAGLDTDLVTAIVELLEVNEEEIGNQSHLTFIELGGDSVKALELTFKLDAFSKSLPLETILDDQSTIVWLSNQLSQCAETGSYQDSATCRTDDTTSVDEVFDERASWSKQRSFPVGTEYDAISREAIEQIGCSKEQIQDILPLTSQQRGLWMGALKQPGSYITHWSHSLSEDTELERLCSAWWEVLQVTPILRTRVILALDSSLFQVAMDADLYKDLCAVEGVMSSKAVATEYGTSLLDFWVESSSIERIFHLTAHHLIYDRRSMQLILDDVRRAYYHHTPIKPRPSYLTLTQPLRDEEKAVLIEQWQVLLAGDPITPGPTLNPYNGSARPTQSRERTVECAKTNATTKAELVAAAWALVCSKHSASADVSFGLTVWGRDMHVSGVAEMAFPTFTTLPFVARFAPGETVRQYLSNIRSTFSQIRQAQRLDLDSISCAAANGQDACRFNSIVVIQPPPHLPSCKEDELLSSRSLKSSHVQPSNPLTLECVPDGNNIHLRLAYDQNFVPAVIAEALLSHLCAALSALSTPAVEIVDEITLFSEYDRKQLTLWTRPCAQLEQTTLSALIQERASCAPDSSAIWQTDSTMTYTELAKSAHLLMERLLLRKDKNPPNHIGVCFEKSAVAIVAMLGVSFAGCAFVPMDPSNPNGRLEQIVADSEMKLVVCSPMTAPKFQDIDVEVMIVGRDLVSEALESTDASSPSMSSPEGTAYVIYTSGSTGKPKGVRVSQGALCTSVKAMGQKLKFCENTRALQFGSFAFDISVIEIWITLTSGGTICMPNEQQIYELDDFIEQAKCNFAALTPSMASTLSNESFRTLGRLVVGGEASSKALFAAAMDAEVELYNGYGPTEACVAFMFAGVGSKTQSTTNLGYSVGATAWIIDEKDAGKLAPIGCVGEVACSGHTLADDYYRDVEKTEAAFRTELPWTTWFPDHTLNRVYRTGDLARYNADGSIEFIGRAGGYAKIRGYRLDIGEIEHALSDKEGGLPHSSIQICRPGTQEDAPEVLVCFYATILIRGAGECRLLSPEHDTEGRTGQASQHLKRLLPSYMIPSAFVPVSHLPYNTAQKLDGGFLKGLLANLALEDIIGKYHAREKTSPSIHALSQQNIVLDEVEDAVRSSDSGIKSVVASTRADERAEDEVTLYYVPPELGDDSGIFRILALENDYAELVMKLHEELQQVLPQTHVPAVYFPVSQIPRAGSRSESLGLLSSAASRLHPSQTALFRPEPGSAVHWNGSRTPTELSSKPEDLNGSRTPTRFDSEAEASSNELSLMAMWSQVLRGEDSLGSFARSSHFVESGGNSLTAIKLSSLARSKGMVLPVNVIFANQRLEDMAQAMSSGSGPQGGSEDVITTPAPFELLSEVPFTPAPTGLGATDIAIGDGGDKGYFGRAALAF